MWALPSAPGAGLSDGLIVRYRPAKAHNNERSDECIGGVSG
jgi:hypothetical protein